MINRNYSLLMYFLQLQAQLYCKVKKKTEKLLKTNREMQKCSIFVIKIRISIDETLNNYVLNP